MADIILAGDSFSLKKLRSAAEQLEDAQNLMQKVYDAVFSTGFWAEANPFALLDGSKNMNVFDGTIDELKTFQQRVQQKEETLRTLAQRIEAAVQELAETDQSFCGKLSGESSAKRAWEQITGAVRSVGQTASAAAVALIGAINGLFFPESTVDGETPSEKSELETKIRFTGKEDYASEVKENLKNVYDDAIDNYRENHELTGEKSGKNYVSHGTTTRGSVNVLGTMFVYDKYYDYRTLDYQETQADSFYSASAGMDWKGTYYSYQSTDGSALSGNITLNGMSAYADGNLDWAKGNAYVKAGLDYTIASGTIVMGDEDLNISLTGEVGAGGHLNAGIHDGKLTVDVSAALGLGLGASFELDFKGVWDEICDCFTFKGW